LSKRSEAKKLSEEVLERQLGAIERLKKRFEGKNLLYSLTTMGCQMNAHDSEKLKGVLEAIGYTETDDENKADFVLYNTCAVRENAELKVYGKIGYLKALKKKNPNLLIVLCGCMMQQGTVIQKLKKSYRHVDIVFGTHNIYKLAELIETRLDTKGTVFDIWEAYEEIVEDLPSIRKSKHKASVNIMYGCNNFCSYCIVPYVRGRERSRYMEDIIDEIKALVADGVKEIVLLGQNVNSYGQKLDEPSDFATLLEQASLVEGLERLRFMTPHPKDLSDDVIKVMAKYDNICPYLHLPFQSGSTKVLKAMNRKYTKEDYLALVDRVNAVMPGIAITTDIIVGFPGETEEDFKDTLDIVERVRYDSAFTFIYSIRTGTPAAIMEDQIEEEVIKDRFGRLLKAVNRIAEEKSKDLIGVVDKVLVDEVNQQVEGMVSGRLPNNHLVHFKGDQALIGEIVTVKIVDAKSFYLIGELIN